MPNTSRRVFRRPVMWQNSGLFSNSTPDSKAGKMRMTQRKIIISGHSSGLGQALAEHYLAEACSVFGIARRSLPPQEGLVQHRLDLADTAALCAWLESGALAEFAADADEIVLLNNAASVLPSALCGQQQPQEIAAAVALNIAAPLLLANHVMAVKPEAAKLKIVHISSGAGRKAYAGWSVYGASKAALDHHARCLAAENHRHTAAVSVAPGVVDTEMQAEIREQPQAQFPLLARFQDLAAQGQLASPQSVAAVLADIIAHEDFGDEALLDVRDWQALQQSIQAAQGVWAQQRGEMGV